VIIRSRIRLAWVAVALLCAGAAARATPEVLIGDPLYEERAWIRPLARIAAKAVTIDEPSRPCPLPVRPHPVSV
jgi:hypothetical protein